VDVHTLGDHPGDWHRDCRLDEAAEPSTLTLNKSVDVFELRHEEAAEHVGVGTPIGKAGALCW
jgi:hypothetical protein